MVAGVDLSEVCADLLAFLLSGAHVRYLLRFCHQDFVWNHALCCVFCLAFSPEDIFTA